MFKVWVYLMYDFMKLLTGHGSNNKGPRVNVTVVLIRSLVKARQVTHTTPNVFLILRPSLHWSRTQFRTRVGTEPIVSS